MATEDRRAWVRALERLEEGDRDGALSLLVAAMEGREADATDGREADAANAGEGHSARAGEADAATGPHDPEAGLLDARLATLLLSILEPRPASSRPEELPSMAGVLGDAPGSGDDPEARLALALEDTLRARRALREGRVDDLLRHARAAADVVPGTRLWPRLYVASVLQAAFRFSADTGLRDRGLEMAGRVADRVDEPVMAVLARGVLATFHILTGRLHAVAECCRSAIDLARATGLADHPHVGMAHQFLGYALFEWNRLDEARTELERAWAVAGPGRPGVRSGVARIMTSLCAAEGRREEAEIWFGRLEEIVSEPMTLRNREWLAAVRIRHGLQTERDLRTIDAWRQGWDYSVADLDDMDDGEILARLHEYEHLLTVLEATGQWDALLAVAESVARAAGEVRPWFTLRALTSRAVAHEGLGRPDEAEKGWGRALADGAAEHFVRVYIDGSSLRLRLLRRALADRATRAHAERVAEAADVEGLDDLVGPSLTPRQLQVLEHLAEGLSNREIAGRLEVSETTVRTHLRDIYGRLDVGSRTAAVARGRELGML